MKRFTETTKWDDPWFWGLSSTAKLLWLFLLDHCDLAGVVDFHLPMASSKLRETIEEHHLTELGERVQTLPNGKLLIPKFIPFQFGVLTETSLIHRSVLKALMKHGIPYPMSIPSTMGLSKGKEKGKGKDQDKEGVQGEGRPTIEAVRLCCAKAMLTETDADWFFNKCEGNGWTNNGKKIKSWPHTIAAWRAINIFPSQKSQINGARQTARTPTPENLPIRDL